MGNEALYLDPHTTQKSGSIGEKISQNEIDMDESYHQKYAARINFEKMDPSLALCFLCKTRTEFDELVSRLRIDICGGTQPLFEITELSQTPWRTVQQSAMQQTASNSNTNGNNLKIGHNGIHFTYFSMNTNVDV